MKRVFIVGSGRCGTSLLQSILASHSEIASFPETHLALENVGHWEKRILGRRLREAERKLRYLLAGIRLRLGLARPSGRRNLRNLARIIGGQDSPMRLPLAGLFIHPNLRAGIALLDDLAAREGKHVWIEKTPGHLAYIDVIERAVPDARFIHLIRNGPDVVASFWDAARKYPERWGYYRDIDRCIARWNHALSLSSGCRDQPRHVLVTYEELVASTAAVISKLCSFIGVGYQDEMLGEYRAAAERVIRGDEPWKRGVTEPIEAQKSSKFFALFDEEQRAHIMRGLTPADLCELSMLRECR